MSFVIYNTEGNGQEDNMERRGREGMWEEGDGTACCTSKWLRFPECAAQSLVVTRLTKLEGFLSLSEAQPERAPVSLLLKLDRNNVNI